MQAAREEEELNGANFSKISSFDFKEIDPSRVI